MLVLVCGLPGTGKSDAAREISKDTGARLLSTDVIRKRIFRKGSLRDIETGDAMKYDLQNIFNRMKEIPPDWRERIEEQKRMVYSRLLKRTRTLMNGGKGVVIDSTLYSRSLREEFYAISDALGAETVVVECVSPEEAVKERIERRDIDRGPSNVNSMEVYSMIKSRYESPEDDGKPMVIFDTNNLSISVINAKRDGIVSSIIPALERLSSYYASRSRQA